MNIKFERDPLDYLKHIEKSLREAPHKQVNGGVLVAEILVDSIDGWCEFLREVIANAENLQGSRAVEHTLAPDQLPLCTCGEGDAIMPELHAKDCAITLAGTSTENNDLPPGIALPDWIIEKSRRR